MAAQRYGYQEGDEPKPAPPEAIMGITDGDIEAILAQVDLAELLQTEYAVPLVESGVGRWKASCPFPNHRDSTPSFYIYEDQRYKCFGCDAGGTAISAVMRIERVSYAEAVCKLAQMVGYEAFLTPEGAIDRTLRDITNLVSNTLADGESKLYLGLTEVGFMNLVRNRLFDYCHMAQVNVTDPFVEERFAQLDDLLEGGTFAASKRFWHELDAAVSEKIISYKRAQHGK